ncbi:MULTISPECIES: right-handed parallel beta-helix repeat-containing protein [unclassified Beijerinckia]|uniref:right-handed parallel beta-helix repeat-containing protein n=1 Tax=unclassified Beijerinckia TaxID=2638183 RepID=UPI000894263A|nr:MULTISPECIES: right-handed parallel beta-helix repeat-containing protein [unclassified Beijerinckia]MDH7797514.1 hypothetical protein [Beijerinckia sp. GAS462]SEC88630.1 Right handed beta helix region [Beijerinckia sp. 28-YEA-48]
MPAIRTIYPIPAGKPGNPGPGFYPRGVYDPLKADYIKGSVVSYGTVLWAALGNVPAGTTPVEGPDWTLFFDVGSEATPALDYSTQSETRAGDPATLKPIKPVEAVDLVNFMRPFADDATAAAGVSTSTVLSPRGGTKLVDAIRPYFTRNEIASATINPSIGAFQTNGYAAHADGGAGHYKRVDTQPSHLGKVQSADGSWWELSENVVNPMMFGAAGDGVADDLTYVQGAISYVRARTRGFALIDRFYAISAPLTVRKGERIVGASMYLSGLLKIGSDSTFFNFDSAISDLPEVSNMRLAHVSGAGASGVAFSFTTVGALGAKINRILAEDLYAIARCALSPLSVNDVLISECEFLRTVNTGFYMQGALNWIIEDNILSMKDGAAGTTCVLMSGLTEGCLFSNNFFLGGQYVLHMDQVKENKFVNTIFDGGSSSAAGIYDTGSKRSHFVNCWVSTQGTGGRGIVLDSANIVGWRWTEGEIIGIQQHAMQVNAASDWHVMGGRIGNYGLQAAATFSGITIAPSSTMRFSIKNVIFAQDADISGNSWNGINVNSGTYGHYEIVGCSGIGLTGSLISDGGVCATALARNNPGYNPRGLSAVTVGASPFTYTAGHQQETLYIRGGTVSDISLATGGTMFNASNVSMALPANRSITITYSAAPTIAVDRH